MRPDVSILIPLHHASRFLDVVRRNIRELSPSARVIVSDPSDTDHAVDLLREEFDGVSNVTFLDRRPLDDGWIPHYNDLAPRVKTPFLMWLAQDDEVDASYVARCRSLLLADRHLGAAVGEIRPIEGDGCMSVPQPPFPSQSELDEYRYPANALLFRWNPGILFRAVFRTKYVTPIRPSFQGDNWADVVWAYGFTLDHRIAQDHFAAYRKRFYSDSTHWQWDRRIFLPACLPHFSDQIERSRLGRTDKAKCRDELLRHATQNIIHHIRNGQVHEEDLRHGTESVE